MAICFSNAIVKYHFRDLKKVQLLVCSSVYLSFYWFILKFFPGILLCAKTKPAKAQLAMYFADGTSLVGGNRLEWLSCSWNIRPLTGGDCIAKSYRLINLWIRISMIDDLNFWGFSWYIFIESLFVFAKVTTSLKIWKGALKVVTIIVLCAENASLSLALKWRLVPQEEE